MNACKKYAIVIWPGKIENHNIIPTEYKIVESNMCPLGNKSCGFHSADVTHCMRGGANGINRICLCKQISYFRPADIECFSDVIRRMGGNVMLQQIVSQLQEHRR